jgi:archaellum component FlaC
MASQARHEDSDISSVVSDRPVLSDSDDSDELLDTQKYRLPDVGKSRGSSRNGFILEDGSIAGRDVVSPPPNDAPNNRYSGNFTAEDVTAGAGESYFNPYGLSRTQSIYTLSRASFSNQISQLTSIKLPEAASLSSSISAIPSSGAAARALNDAADQIRRWMTKANEVLDGLDAEDEVEWAAAGGRDGLGEVDVAINRFETLIEVYVGAIENLESRSDIDSLSPQDLNAVVDRMEKILHDWARIKQNLEGVKQQVEVAMEWEELWNTVLGEIGMESENLGRLVFEMEERRHKSSLLDALAEPGQGLDIKELETIVEEAPARNTPIKDPGSDDEEDEEPGNKRPKPHEDSNLLALFARLQPLRASLDFLPMRLSEFLGQARPIFPSACEELEDRQRVLEAKYQKLEADAESLRKELGEDRWVLIFRKAGRQALKMCESVERSVVKLRDVLDDAVQANNPVVLAKKIENYEAKKEHYGPAIQQVLAIIDRGVQSRLTVNGEILRLQADMQKKWKDLEATMKGMDTGLEQLNISRTHQLRDSISTILSEQQSIASSTGTLIDTPASSPASSVVLLSPHGGSTPFTSKSRQGSFTSTTTARAKRYSSLPTPVGQSSGMPRKTPVSKSSASNLRASVSGVSSRLYQPPPPTRSLSRSDNLPNSTQPNRPPWNGSTNMRDTPTGHHFKPLSATTPSPFRKNSGTSGVCSPGGTYSVPSPLGREFNLSRPASTVPSTPGERVLRNKLSSSLMRPKAGTAHTSTGVPQSATKGAHPATPGARSGLPRASMYMTPGGTPDSLASSAASSVRAGGSRHVSRGSAASSTSTATVTLAERPALRRGSVAVPTPQGTPASLAGSLDDGASSPTAARGSRVGSRPGTALGGSSTGTTTPAASSSTTTTAAAAAGGSTGRRRLSMLPQPKRAVSSRVAVSAAQAAMAGSDARRVSEADRPKWR